MWIYNMQGPVLNVVRKAECIKSKSDPKSEEAIKSIFKLHCNRKKHLNTPKWQCRSYKTTVPTCPVTTITIDFYRQIPFNTILLLCKVSPQAHIVWMFGLWLATVLWEAVEPNWRKWDVRGCALKVRKSSISFLCKFLFACYQLVRCSKLLHVLPTPWTLPHFPCHEITSKDHKSSFL